MRILSPEKKYLYFLMIGQLHEDGYTQQAVQLEASTLYTSNGVKASDKLSRLFSSCLASVNEAASYFNAKGHQIAGKRRIGQQSPANIRAASLANLAKRRKTAAGLDTTNMLQDSIKKCVKLVTTDLQKATADIGKAAPNPSVMVSPTSSSSLPGPSRQLTPTHNRMNPSPKQKPSVSTAMVVGTGRPKTSNHVPSSLLRGINLFKNAALPKVTPFTSPTAKPRSMPAPPRMSESASVVRVVKNISNDPIVIDVEAPSVSMSSNYPSSALQLTHPISGPSSASNRVVMSSASVPSQVHQPARHGPDNFMLTSPRSHSHPHPSQVPPQVTPPVGAIAFKSRKSLMGQYSESPIQHVPRNLPPYPGVIPSSSSSVNPSGIMVNRNSSHNMNVPPGSFPNSNSMMTSQQGIPPVILSTLGLQPSQHPPIMRHPNIPTSISSVPIPIPTSVPINQTVTTMSYPSMTLPSSVPIYPGRIPTPPVIKASSSILSSPSSSSSVSAGALDQSPHLAANIPYNNYPIKSPTSPKPEIKTLCCSTHGSPTNVPSSQHPPIPTIHVTSGAPTNIPTNVLASGPNIQPPSTPPVTSASDTPPNHDLPPMPMPHFGSSDTPSHPSETPTTSVVQPTSSDPTSPSTEGTAAVSSRDGETENANDTPIIPTEVRRSKRKSNPVNYSQLADEDFPHEIFAEELMKSTEFLPPASVSDALHAASDALLEQ